MLMLIACGLAVSTPGLEPRLQRETTRFAATSTGVDIETPWWLLFSDADLTSAIETGLANNYDLKTAAARVVLAEASSLRALAPLLPQLTADASAQVAPFDALGFQFGGAIGDTGQGGAPPSVFYTGSALLNARWQLDVWGQSYLGQLAARLQARATEGDRASVALALTNQIGTAYFDVVFSKQLIAVVKEQIAANRRLLELIELRFERGDATSVDVLQQKQQYAARAAELPPLRAQLRAAQQRLAILVGEAPSRTPPSTASKMPALPPPPALGEPADLLEHRPQLKAALLRLEAADAQAAQSVRSFLPAVSVDGNAGWQFFRATETNELFVWGAGVTVSLPIFKGFDNVGRVREARARTNESQQALNQTFLLAVQEVEGAWINERETRAQLALVGEQAKAAQAALDESESRYLSGLTDYLNVLTALNAVQGAQRGELQTQRGLLGARLQLYQALGGPWSQDLGSSPPDGGSKK